MQLIIFIMLIKLTIIQSAHLNVSESSNSQVTCVCMPFWQCKEDFSELVQDDIDSADIRRKRSTEYKISCTGDWDVCCRVKCGRKNNLSHFTEDAKERIGFRILGANNEADFGEFPWMLGILKNNVFLCGASLIHPQVAITAAHCVSGSRKYIIRAGEWDWTSRDEPLPHQDRSSQKIIIHPYYNTASLQNDIALVVLETPFFLTGNIGVVCLPSQGSAFVNEQCTASGWGKNSFNKGQYQPTLKKVELPTISRESCAYYLREARLGPYFQLHRSFICAGGKANEDTCKGDGGSPLVCPTFVDRFVQVGIVSWGLTCGLQNTPGVYVNIALFVDWIDEEMKYNQFDSDVYKI